MVLTKMERGADILPMAGYGNPGAFADALFAADRQYMRGGASGRRNRPRLAFAVWEHACELVDSGECSSPAWAAVAAAPLERVERSLIGYLQRYG